MTRTTTAPGSYRFVIDRKNATDQLGRLLAVGDEMRGSAPSFAAAWGQMLRSIVGQIADGWRNPSGAVIDHIDVSIRLSRTAESCDIDVRMTSVLRGSFDRRARTRLVDVNPSAVSSSAHGRT